MISGHSRIYFKQQGPATGAFSTAGTESVLGGVSIWKSTVYTGIFRQGPEARFIWELWDRCGPEKSTFIKRFMEQMVLPGITDEHQKNRTRDELPQSAAGKTIMTTEPKFVPKEAARIELGEDTAVKVRLVDCVGFMTEGASGHMKMKRSGW